MPPSVWSDEDLLNILRAEAHRRSDRSAIGGQFAAMNAERLARNDVLDESQQRRLREGLTTARRHLENS